MSSDPHEGELPGCLQCTGTVLPCSDRFINFFLNLFFLKKKLKFMSYHLRPFDINTLASKPHLRHKEKQDLKQAAGQDTPGFQISREAGEWWAVIGCTYTND